MKLIKFKTIQTDAGESFVYKDVLINTLKVHGQGMTLDEMERVLRIVKTIRDTSERVVLEDADHEYVVKRLENTAWRVADSAIVQFVKDVKGAQTLDANALLKE